ncbi:hypothetical protein BGW39_006587 [Mortierella sp. 14UC]|nr:hypothetical protein BGW39_006587 [Mortierella sp. 14UC]
MAVVSRAIRRSSYDFHNGFLGLLLSVSLTIVVTQVVKVTVGKHRPDFLDRCKPMLNGVAVTHDEPMKLWTVDICTTTDHSGFKDGMRSFPSGHASSEHLAADVGWGTVIGIFFAFFAYHQYYPSISRSHSHIPYPPHDFGHLVKDNDGKVHGSGRLEALTGIRPNDESVGEMQQQPERLADLEAQEK